MKELLLKINLVITFCLAVCAIVCVSFALEGGDALPGWMQYVWYGLAAESAVWIGCLVGAVVNHFASLPPMRRGYIRFDDRFGWIDEGGRRP